MSLEIANQAAGYGVVYIAGHQALRRNAIERQGCHMAYLACGIDVIRCLGRGTPSNFNSYSCTLIAVLHLLQSL